MKDDYINKGITPVEGMAYNTDINKLLNGLQLNFNNKNESIDILRRKNKSKKKISKFKHK